MENWKSDFSICLQERVCKPRNPAPVSNPSKGHYLKKSPSPTGNKSPPGHPLSSNNGASINNGANITTDEYSQRKPLLAQVRPSCLSYSCTLLNNRESIKKLPGYVIGTVWKPTFSSFRNSLLQNLVDLAFWYGFERFWKFSNFFRHLTDFHLSKLPLKQTRHRWDSFWWFGESFLMFWSHTSSKKDMIYFSILLRICSLTEIFRAAVWRFQADKNYKCAVMNSSYPNYFCLILVPKFAVPNVEKSLHVMHIYNWCIKLIH